MTSGWSRCGFAWLPEEHGGPARGQGGRPAARTRPVPPQRTAAAADPGAPAGAGGGAGRGARHARVAAAALGRDHRRRRLRRLRGPPGHARARPGRVPAARPHGTRRRAWSRTKSCPRAGPERAARGPRGPDGSPASLEEAGEILDELAAGWSRRLIDVMPTIGRLIFQRGFDPQIDYDESQVERVRAAMERHPGIFLWSHRSNLDTLVLAAAMQELGLPPAHLFAGINMAFGPMGALMRRAGVIFIRRSTSDDPLYKYVLREYVGVRAREAVQPFLVHRGHPVADGKGAAAAARPAVYAADVYLSGRVDDNRAAAGVDHVRPAARDLRVRRLRQGRGEEAGRVRLAVRLHQGAGGAPLRQGVCAVRRAGADVFVPRAGRWRGGA